MIIREKKWKMRIINPKCQLLIPIELIDSKFVCPILYSVA